jgi:Flp pilus assembly protein TadG
MSRLYGSFQVNFLKDERGQAALVMSLFLAIMALGFMALAVDTGYFFHEKRMAQSAADAAAVAAAEESVAGASSNMQSVANSIAKMNGFDTTLATNPAKVQINNPPLYGAYAGNSNYVEAIVSRPVPTLLLGAFNPTKTAMTVSARAVSGGGQTAPTCICLEEPTGMGLNMSNDAQLNAIQCGITVDSGSSNAVGVVGSADINALSLGTVSTNWDNSSNVNNAGTISSNTKVVTGVSACSPTIAAPTLPSGITCYPNPINGYILAPNYNGNWTLPLQGASQMVNGQPQALPNEQPTSGVVCYQSLNLSDASSVTFTPGYTYYIQGGFTTGGGASITGNGVSFYIAGAVNIANGVTVNLSAPTVNGTPGTLFYVAGSSVVIQGGSNSNFSGLIYAPSAAMTLNNGTGTTTNMDIVAQSLTMAGGAALNSYASTNMGTLNTSVAKLAE